MLPTSRVPQSRGPLSCLAVAESRSACSWGIASAILRRRKDVSQYTLRIKKRMIKPEDSKAYNFANQNY